MAKVHIVNLVEIRHWIVPDDSERDEGRWVTQYRFQNANVDRNIVFENHEYSFPVLHLQRCNPHQDRRQHRSITAGIDQPDLDGLRL